MSTVLDRVLARLDRSGGPDACWLWVGPTTEGYGRMSIDGQHVYAHRVMWEIANNAAIPEGQQIDHLCCTPRCANPKHLEPVSASTNVRRAKDHVWRRNLAKEFCPANHPYDAENTYLSPSKRNQFGQPTRFCRECHREASRRYRARKKAEAAA